MLLNKSFRLLALTSFILCACEPHIATENKELEKKMVGEWNSASLKITMNTFGNKDTTNVFEVEEKNWENKMNIRPVRTIYFADGTYMAEHRNLNDSIIFNPFGKWKIMDDTIILRDTFRSRDLHLNIEL